MSVRITRVREGTSQEWDDSWRASAASTWFHSREWAEAWRRTSRGQVLPDPRVVEFSDGATAFLPLCVEHRLGGLFRVSHSSPAGTYGGWIGGRNLTVEHARALADHLTRRRSLYWRLNPFDPLQRDLESRYGRRDDTQVIDLSGGFDAVLEAWEKDGGAVARKIRKARKCGVTVRPALSYEDWTAYFAVYQESIARWRTGPSIRYGMGLFEALFEGRSPNVQLWLAFHEGSLAAGAICFYSSWHAVYWHGAARESAFPHRPVNLLFHEILRDACARSARVFDLNPSGPHEGVRRFKRSLRATEVPCTIVDTRRPPSRVRSLWRSLSRSGR